MADPTAQLSTRLADYETKLAKLDTLLLGDPANATFLKLRSQLVGALGEVREALARATVRAPAPAPIPPPLPSHVPALAAAERAPPPSHTSQGAPSQQRPAFRLVGSAAAPAAAAAAATAAGAGASAAAAEGEDDDEGEGEGGGGMYADLVVPDNLRSHLTDTAEERLRKKKKVKALRQKHRLKKLEATAAAATSSWKAFSATLGRKRTGGGGGGGGGP
jgi:hypothetical protein